MELKHEGINAHTLPLRDQSEASAFVPGGKCIVQRWVGYGLPHSYFLAEVLSEPVKGQCSTEVQVGLIGRLGLGEESTYHVLTTTLGSAVRLHSRDSTHVLPYNETTCGLLIQVLSAEQRMVGAQGQRDHAVGVAGRILSVALKEIIPEPVRKFMGALERVGDLDKALEAIKGLVIKK
jgi:hypothetical protein